MIYSTNYNICTCIESNDTLLLQQQFLLLTRCSVAFWRYLDRSRKGQAGHRDFGTQRRFVSVVGAVVVVFFGNDVDIAAETHPAFFDIERRSAYFFDVPNYQKVSPRTMAM